MTTESLRTLTETHCTTLNGRLWPNGIGFDRRGWEFFYVEATGYWTARRLGSDGAWYWGWGDTPSIAQAHARYRRTRKVN